MINRPIWLALTLLPLTRPPLAQETEQSEIVTCGLALERAWQALDQGDIDAARPALAAGTASSRCEVISTRAERPFLAGRLALLSGDLEEARDQLRQARRSRSGPLGERPSEAEALYYEGLANEASGDTDRALELYGEMAEDYPADAHVAVVLGLLQGVTAATPTERLAAALNAIETHNYSAAGRLLEGVISAGVGQPVQPHDPGFQAALMNAIDTGPDYLGEAAYQLGYLWYYWIRSENPQAIPLLTAVSQTRHTRRDDAAYFLARAYMRDEQYEPARAAWAEFADRFPRDSRVHEATYYRGWLYLDREQFAEGLPGFLDYVDQHSGADRIDRARWYVGWSYYRLGRYEEALEHFHRLGRRGGYLLGAKGQYWEGRTLQAMGREAEAEEVLRDLADDYTFTHYGMLARQRLGEPPLPPRSHERPPWPTERLAELEGESDDLSVLRQLIDAGMVRRAGRFYEATRPDRDVRGDIDQTLIQQAAGDAYAAFRDADTRVGSRIRRQPTDRTMLRWLQAFPRPHDTAGRAAGEEFAVDPLLMWSHMQIESHYHPGMVSYADAQGLLQLIQRTGQHVATALGESYTEGMLMDPGINIRYGTWYLGALIREYRGQLPLAITAYNSGSHAMHRWVDENHDLEFDAFIEEIPYDQSREYVKRVIGIYAHFLYLYADDEHYEQAMQRLLPERIDPDYLGEINY